MFLPSPSRFSIGAQEHVEKALPEIELKCNKEL